MDILERHVKDICNNYYKYLLSLENVNGIGYGFKYINNLNIFKPCLNVLVEKKVPKNYISKNNLIPKEYMGVLTDVVEVGRPKFKRRVESITQKFRPLESGSSISCLEGAGTLGCIVTKPYFHFFKQYFILSNNHVLADSNKNTIGAPVFQPSTDFGGEYKDNIVGTLEDFIPLKFINEKNIDDPPINYADCAIAKLNSGWSVSNKIYGLGKIKGIGEINLGEKVRKVGYVSGLTEGYISELHVSSFFESDDEIIYFQELTAIDLINEPGDSGSIVVNMDNEVLGLFLGGTDTTAYMNDINFILEEFNVSLYTG